MEVIKTSTNVEFDVIYADGTCHHVAEGILFAVENEKIVLHNGTDRPAVIVAAAEAASEIVGSMELPVDAISKLIANIFKNLTC